MKALIDGVIRDLPDFAHPDILPLLTTLSAGVFFDRFTPAETAAVWAAAKSADPALVPIGVGLMQGLANGAINLASPVTQAWVQGLVAAGVITAARAVAVLTP